MTHSRTTSLPRHAPTTGSAPHFKGLHQLSFSRLISRTITIGLVAGTTAFTAVPAQADSVTENFDDVAALTTWKVVNLSSPDDEEEPSWTQGDTSEFTAHEGAESSFIGVEYDITSGEDVSAWLIMPQQTSLSSTDVLSFWTRSTVTDYPDRLEVRMSTNGSCSPGSTTEGVGDFTTVLTTINPDQADGGYPGDWTQYTVPLTGLGAANVSGCLAFRYHIQDTDKHGQYVGIDSLTFTDNASGACTTAQSAVKDAQAQVAAATATVTAATATATTTKQVVTKTKKALKKAKNKVKKTAKKLKKAKKDEASVKVTKLKKKVKQAKRKVKKAKKKVTKARSRSTSAAQALQSARTGLTTAQTALATAQRATTTSCP